MEQEKRTYFVEPGKKELVPENPEREGHFRVFLTNEELQYFKSLFDENYTADLETFVRAHIPFLDYETGSENDHYDRSLITTYGLIYQFGDEEAKRHIERMGILKRDTLNNKSGF